MGRAGLEPAPTQTRSLTVSICGENNYAIIAYLIFSWYIAIDILLFAESRQGLLSDLYSAPFNIIWRLLS
jgi:hypothetical protein